MSEEFIREVDEELKEEKYARLWKKFGPYVIGLAFSIILVTVGFVLWKNYVNSSQQSLGDDFSAAVELVQENDIDAALVALDKVSESSSDGYVTLAKLKKAALLIEKEEIKKGLEIYLDLEKSAVNKSFRDIATLFYVLNSMDTNPPQLLMKKIDSLIDNSSWSSSALELQAFLFLKMNDVESAQKTFKEIVDKKSIPSSLKRRSQDMINFLKGK